jgi:hypothetical protein
MEPASRSPGTAPGLAGVIGDAADLAASAAGTDLETQALGLFAKLLDAAEEDLKAAHGTGPEQDAAVATALLASAVLQGRAALAARELTAQALDAARRSGREEGFEEGRRTRPRGAAGSRRAGLPALRSVRTA